jgi:hypothetical protein
MLVASSVGAQSSVLELNDAGWKAIEQGDGMRAARLFREALAERPDDPVLLFGAGAAAHLDGRPKDAIAGLQRAVEVNPKLTPAALLLGEIAYAEGDVAQAISVYEKALEHAPGNADLTSRLAAWRADAEVHRGFEERRYDRFRVMFQGRADESLAAQATEMLNARFWKIGQALGAYPSDAVVVMLYTERQFRDITQAPEWSGGLYDGRIRVPASGAAQSPQAFERVLVHELVHAMVAGMAPRGVPSWLHEGLAQHFEGDDVGEARRRLQAGGRMIPLRHLEGSFTHLSAADARVAYDESLVAVEAILQRPGFNWSRLFRALMESNRTEYTFDTFGLRYSDLEAEFAR